MRKCEDHFMATVKLGPKGQIVIPKEVREMFGLSSGDTLVLMADKKRGIALQQSAVLAGIADAIFHQIEASDEERAFAEAVQQELEE
ncbi:MAG: AbrB/MazE/SpoVT family DNA-binding domain-containing protein [Clostridia bacterium]|nr:AbrB/MazE/SpoVT family DNA-binding domain-containing protein [Clostridia bacterium]